MSSFPSEISEWWPLLPENIRNQILTAPDAPLSSAALISITNVRGVGPAGSYWADSEQVPRFYFTDAEREWIHQHGGDTTGSRTT